VEAGDFVEDSMVEHMEDADDVEDAHENVISTMEMGALHSNANESMMEEHATIVTANEKEHKHAAMNDIEMGSCTAAHDNNANNECMGMVENVNTATTANDKDEFHNASTMRDAIDSHLEMGAPCYIKLRTASGKRTVPNCCAVCLCTYKEGETIVWSSNGKCLHAFHNECVMEWLIKVQNGTPCPCCRQEFTDLNL
jgi:Anaphase-promoting complex subunit 11 RING-H2 finger